MFRFGQTLTSWLAVTVQSSPCVVKDPLLTLCHSSMCCMVDLIKIPNIHALNTLCRPPGSQALHSPAPNLPHPLQHTCHSPKQSGAHLHHLHRCPSQQIQHKCLTWQVENYWIFSIISDLCPYLLSNLPLSCVVLKSLLTLFIAGHINIHFLENIRSLSICRVVVTKPPASDSGHLASVVIWVSSTAPWQADGGHLSGEGCLLSQG